MKNPNHPHSSYYSTSQTAQMLGLSVGTIQRMVEAGHLQAYTTQGGHRRILAASVRHYCQQHGVPGVSLLPASQGACVLHPADAPLAPAEAWAQLPQVQQISHPLDLAGLGEELSVFFIDARVGWLDWPDWHRPSGLLPQSRFVVYHSEVLSPEQQSAVAQQAQLLVGDITPELVRGYLLALHTPEPASPPGLAGNGAT